MILLGPPGVEGTQGELLAEQLAATQISTGDTLRTAVAAGNALGRELGSTLADGRTIDHVVDKVDDDVLVGRIAQRRADSPPRPDDHAATLKNRLLIYHRTAAPLIAGKFISVDSMAPIPTCATPSAEPQRKRELAYPITYARCVVSCAHGVNTAAPSNLPARRSAKAWLAC